MRAPFLPITEITSALCQPSPRLHYSPSATEQWGPTKKAAFAFTFPRLAFGYGKLPTDRRVLSPKNGPAGPDYLAGCTEPEQSVLRPQRTQGKEMSIRRWQVIWKGKGLSLSLSVQSYTGVLLVQHSCAGVVLLQICCQALLCHEIGRWTCTRSSADARVPLRPSSAPVECWSSTAIA